MSESNSARIENQAPQPLQKEPSFEAVVKATDAERRGNHYMGRCPCHDDSKRSLSISRGKHQAVIVKCHAGCNTRDIHEVLKAKGAPIFPEKRATKSLVRGAVSQSYEYQDESGVTVSRVIRKKPKGFYQQRADGKGGWINKMARARVVPYRLPELLEAVSASRPVFVVEGEKDADNLAKLGIAATCNAGGAGKWTGEHARFLKGADVVIIPDNDDVGRKHAATVATSVETLAQRIRFLELPGLPEKGDVSDWIERNGTAEAFWQAVEKHGRKVGAETIDDAEDDTARRPRLKSRELDPCAHWRVEVWEGEVDTAELLSSLARTFSRFLMLPKHSANIMALWVLHTWALDAFDISPYLLVNSPTRGCGKSTLLTLHKWLLPRTYFFSNATGPTIFRIIEKEEPSLILDEAETWVKHDEGLRGILNGGHMRSSAFVPRCVGEGTNQEVRHFTTWCPKVIACIGKLADTLMSRSIVVTLRRITQNERVDRKPLRDRPEFGELRSKCLKWAFDNIEHLAHNPPHLPDELYARTGDNWEPLFAVAEIAGEAWIELAHTAAQETTKQTEEGDFKIKLLEDIRTILMEQKDHWLGAAVLTQKLVDMEESPWGEMPFNGRPLTTRQLGQMLKDFGIKSRKTNTANVYEAKQFKEAWESYLSPYLPPQGN